MGASLGGWRLLVHIFLPIPLVLTLLLVVPFPRNVRKGILIFTHKTLSFTMIGGMKLVHFSLFASGIPLVDSVFRTLRSSQAAESQDVRPELKIGLLAKKWREERNFWIAAMGFTLWCLLSVLYAQVSKMVSMEDQIEELKDEVADLKGEPRTARGADAVNAKVAGVKDAVNSFAQQVKSNLPGRSARRAPASPAPAADGSARHNSPLTRRAAAAAAAKTE